MSETLFPDLVPLELPQAEPGEKLSADRRRTLRQRADVARGRHPLTGSRLAVDGATCGNCRFRQLLETHSRSYAKCVHPGGFSAEQYERFGPPRVSHSAASDVRAWWPGCTDHEWGDTKLSPDAMRSGPPRGEA